NKFNFTNINRGFKLTDVDRKYDKRGVENVSISRFPATNILFLNNSIYSNASNGKQLFDFFDGTGRVLIKGNYIYSKGHSNIFEDKTDFKPSIERYHVLKGNKIYTDFRILHYDGNVQSSKNASSTLEIEDNEFHYIGSFPTLTLKRRLDSNNIATFKFDYFFSIRNLESFKYSNNRFYAPSVPEIVMFKIVDVLNTDVIESDLLGSFNFISMNRPSQLRLSRNHIFPNRSDFFVNVINREKIKFAKFEVTYNQISGVPSTFKISNFSGSRTDVSNNKIIKDI